MHPPCLARAFVLTALAATSCDLATVVGKRPPPRTRKAGPAGDRSKSASEVELGTLTPLNPTDAKGRQVYAHGAVCVVVVPRRSPQTSWEGPDYDAVDCPPQMDDPAWDHCPGTLHRRQDGGGCVCTVVGGNPPPPPWGVPCPQR